MQAVSIAGAELSDFRFDNDDDLSDLGGAASHFKCNVAALALLKRLEAKSHPHGELGRNVTDRDRCASPQSKNRSGSQGSERRRSHSSVRHLPTCVW
jgi:hypothetical protein